MIVQCPECHTKYRLSAYLLGRKGRDVRCSSCRHVWFHAATKAELDAEAAEAVLVFEEADRHLTVQELEEAIAGHEAEEAFGRVEELLLAGGVGDARGKLIGACRAVAALGRYNGIREYAFCRNARNSSTPTWCGRVPVSTPAT